MYPKQREPWFSLPLGSHFYFVKQLLLFLAFCFSVIVLVYCIFRQQTNGDSFRKGLAVSKYLFLLLELRPALLVSGGRKSSCSV